MNPLDPWKSYRRVSTQTAPPGQLVLMLYDGAIRFLERALLGFGQDDPVEFHQTIHNNLKRAQDILDELNMSLDLARGGELARKLRQLYQYMHDRLHESNRTKTPEGIREVVRRLSTLREAWSQMLQGVQPPEGNGGATPA